MRIQTFSVVAGSRACDAHCPFCVSKMTGVGKIPHPGDFNERNLKKAIALAKLGQSTTCLITGKGEPTLYPNMITKYLSHLGQEFPFIELQTNGLQIGWLAEGNDIVLTEDHLRDWHHLGLDTIALSIVSTDLGPNKDVYNKNYPTLSGTVDLLHDLQYSVRLCVMMMKGGVDSVEKLQETLKFCKHNGVDQLTIRPINYPKNSHDAAAIEFVREHSVEELVMAKIRKWIVTEGTRLLPLMHGAWIFDIEGQNVCLSDCLTVSEEEGQIRTLIYYGDGRISFDWQYDGALLLGAGKRSYAH